VRADLKAIKKYVDEVLKGVTQENMKVLKRAVLDELLKIDKEYYEEALNLAKELAEAVERGFEKANYSVGRLDLALKTEGLVGIGFGALKAVFEVGLNVDPILGLPYYPGSGIKGAVRAFLEGCAPSEAVEPLLGKSVAEGGQASKVIFADAYPVGCAGKCSIFYPLVTTPHYFEGGKVVDNELKAKPVPVVYAGISRNTVFRLIIAVRRDEGVIKDVQKLKDSLKDEGGCKIIKGILEKVLSSGAEDPNLPLKALVLITAYVMRRGIAARSQKGFNVFEPLDKDLTSDVVYWFDVVGLRSSRG